MKDIIFDVPPLPFKELPKVPACFCSYPIIFSCTYDMKLKAWVWRLDMEAEVGKKFGHLQIPCPINPETGLPVEFNVVYLCLALHTMASKLREWIQAGQPIVS